MLAPVTHTLNDSPVLESVEEVQRAEEVGSVPGPAHTLLRSRCEEGGPECRGYSEKWAGWEEASRLQGQGQVRFSGRWAGDALELGQHVWKAGDWLSSLT